MPSSPWPFAIFWMLSNVFKLLFTGWSRNFFPLVITFNSTFRRQYFTLTVLSSNDKPKSPWKLGSVEKSKYGFGACVVTFVRYLFQSIVLLKPDFNCCNSFALSWVDNWGYNWGINVLYLLLEMLL